MPSVEDLWAPYAPTTAEPWNVRLAVHLHRRAGFAATWSEIERDVAGPPQEAVTRLLEAPSRVDAQPADYESMTAMLTDTAVGSQMDARLKAAWVYRMLFSPDPLGERLTLVWHNHFATSNRKVQNLPQMRQQNDQLRKYARAAICSIGGCRRSRSRACWCGSTPTRTSPSIRTRTWPAS